jgi:hypothetical protein
MPRLIFWSLIGTNFGFQVAHFFIMSWADYPRGVDAPKMAEVRELVIQESGLTELNIIAFVNAVSGKFKIHKKNI